MGITIVVLGLAQAGSEPLNCAMHVIPSWGDLALVYGPGTHPAMDSGPAMEAMVRHWQGRGFTGMYLRTDLTQCPPGSIIRHEADTQAQPTLAVCWHLIDTVLARCDPHTQARQAAARLGFEYWMWHPHIYSEGAPVEAGVPGPGRMVPWSYMRRYHREHPEVITVDREGNRQWMVPEYAYPGARADKAAEFAHMARTYRPTGIIASMRSESSQLIPPPEHADQFGFNPIVAAEMQRRHGVDILTDARFDWRRPGFDLHDPMLANWRALRGEHITELYREIRAALRAAAPEVRFAVALSGETVGPILGNARLEWRRWIDEGIVDAILLPVTFEATLDLDCGGKGYLTDVRAGKGLVSAAEVKEYIRRSPHPQIAVVQTGAPSYFYPPPPAGADGWQCDIWYDAYHLAWYQRWEQWQRDLRDNGAIRFLQQDFDGFPVRDPGSGGGVGDGRYDPATRSCPGVWYTLGDGRDARPYVQQDVRRGDTGAAIAVTGGSLTAQHQSSPDRSLYSSWVDPAITNGKARLSCWVYRSGPESSLSLYFSGNAQYETDVGLRLEPGSGRVSYATGARWVESPQAVPVGQWCPLELTVDADAQTYAAGAGPDRAPVCSGIPFAPPAAREVTLPGVNLPIAVPSYRLFNVWMFVGNEGTREPVYLDDVLVTWVPTLHLVEPGRRTLLEESFETVAGDLGESLGRGWRILGPAASGVPFQIERTTSFGPGVHCLRATGGGALVADLGQHLSRAGAAGLVTVDLDLFLRSGKDFPYMLPDPTTTSPHSVVIALEGSASGQRCVAVDAAGGTWRLWDGQAYADSGHRVTYDVWVHLQMALDPDAGTYRLVVQPVGELPRPVGEAACGAAVSVDEALALAIRPSATPGHLSCYDNLRVTCDGRGRMAAQGSAP